ncbi:FMN phosphatase YigB (HAD superfamily) [Bradyrhizobium sp. USDA 4486]
MSPQELAASISSSGAIDLISTDVFDTLLLRTTRSARSRIRQGEHLFSRSLAARGWQIEPSLLMTARAEAERLAFRALEVGRSGEVRLTDVIGRQLKMLGLPTSEVATRLAIELNVEKTSLILNRHLANVLLAQRYAGRRIVAVSDTMLSSENVRELIRHFYVRDLIDQIYTSADCARTKRQGDLFPHVAETEGVSLSRILHIGDDVRADVRNASAHGITAIHTPRPIWLGHLRKANGALAMMRVALSSKNRFARRPPATLENAFAFGRFVLGPIVTQFCLRIWLYAAEVEAHDRSALLFCARGGVGIREAFERVLARLSLPLGMRRDNIMVSRLVAARAAILTRSSSAVEEIAREFRGRSFSDVASALGGRRYSLPDRWNKPFVASDFLEMLFDNSAKEVLSDIRQQNALFERHFSTLRNDSSRILLCDTGLYGSTQRLLASAFPALNIETIQFARANYKQHGEEHFQKVAGLVVERNCYSPLDVHSCVLRYWHLIESLFEPAIPSVRLFTDGGGDEVAANCGDIRYGFIDPSHRNDLLSGTLTYIDELSIEGAAKASADAELAWLRLKKAITRPTAGVLRCLDLPGRSVDFGRPDVLNVFGPRQAEPTFSRLASLRAELWREGAIAREFPILKHALLPMLDSVHSVRAVIARP